MTRIPCKIPSILNCFWKLNTETKIKRTTRAENMIRRKKNYTLFGQKKDYDQNRDIQCYGTPEYSRLNCSNTKWSMSEENFKLNKNHWMRWLTKEQLVNREIRRLNMIDWNELTVFVEYSALIKCELRTTLLNAFTYNDSVLGTCMDVEFWLCGKATKIFIQIIYRKNIDWTWAWVIMIFQF